ncbi:MAG: BamA/TamA family outer membrane protein [Candidatus Krumholzibacteriia bacterium]
MSNPSRLDRPDRPSRCNRSCHIGSRVRRSTLVLLLALILGLMPAAALVWPTPAAAQESDAAQERAAEQQAEEADPVPVLRAIEIKGNERTSANVVRREIGLEPGDPFPEELVDPIWDRLEDLGYFAFVDLTYDEVEPGEVILRVVVEEERALGYGPVLRYSDRHKYLMGGWVRDRNFRGEGEIVEAQIVTYRIQQLTLGWTRPWFLGVPGLSLAARTGAEQGDFVWRATDYSTWRSDLETAWRIRGPFFAEASGGYRVYHQRESFTAPPVDRGDATVAGPVLHPEHTRRSWILGGGVGLDARNNPFYPTSGAYGRLGGRWVAGDNFDSFGEWSGDLRLFVPIRDDLVLALRGYGVLVTDPQPIEDRLYWGGAESIRGHDRASVEGENGYLLTAEIRVPLFLMPISPEGELVGFGLHAFADAGDAWYEGDESGTAVHGWGLGVHLNVAAAQFRFEAANDGEGDWAFQFTDRFNF